MFVRLAFLSALLVLLPEITCAQQAFEDFEPEDGLFAFYDENPYAAIVARELLGGDRNRKCQMLFIPSFSAEKAVYFVRDDKSQTSTVVFREFEKHLWPEMQNAFRKEFPGGAPTKVQEAQLIETLRKSTKRLEAPLTKETADILDQVCGRVLARVRYAPGLTIGLDGVSYHAAHYQVGFGYRAGEVWSPAKGTIASDFVELAETLATLAPAAPADRSRVETTLTQQAERLLERVR